MTTALIVSAWPCVGAPRNTPSFLNTQGISSAWATKSLLTFGTPNSAPNVKLLQREARIYEYAGATLPWCLDTLNNVVGFALASYIGGHLRGRRCKDGISVHISYPFLVLIQAAIPRSEVVQKFKEHSADITGQYRGTPIKFSTRSF